MNTKTQMWRRLAGLCGVFLLIFAGVSPAFAAQVQIFSNEQREENANTQILDFDNTGGNVILQFGNTLAEQLYWDNTAGQFTFTDDLSVSGGLTVGGNIDVNLNQLVEARVENLSSAPTCNAGATGRIYHNTTDNNSYVCNGSTWEQIDAGAGTSTGTTSNTYTLDNDDTGGNVDLIFGTTVGQYLRHDGTIFHFSDTVQIDAANALQFRDAQLAINSSADGQLDIDADTEVEITAPNVDLNGNLDVSGTLVTGSTINGATLSTTLLDFNGNATIGDNANTVAIDGTNWDVNSTGTATGLSINADTNTLTNIEDADIKANANIDFSKLATRTKKMLITMNDMTVQQDGSNNVANLYNDSETGANPHQFYLVKSSQGTLQDLTMVMKVRLPQDFVSFANAGDLSFFYKNTGTDNTDSKQDILVEDDDGDDAFTAADGQNLFNTSWTEHTDEFDAGSFNPAAGEYIYVTLKGYASKDGATFQNSQLGEIVLAYTGR